MSRMNDLQKISQLGPALTSRYIKKSYPDLYQSLVDQYGPLKASELVYLKLHNLSGPARCPVCGRPTKYINISKGYSKCCSMKCAAVNGDRTKKIKATKRLRYGDENYNNRPRAVATTLERYGVENAFSSPEIQKKIQATIQTKYGVDYPSQSAIIQHTREQNSLQKYGVKSHTCLEEVKAKGQRTHRNRRIATEEDLVGYDESGNYIMQCPHPGCTKCQEKVYGTHKVSQPCYIIHPQNYYARKRYGLELCTNLHPVQTNWMGKTWIEEFVKNILNDHSIPWHKDRTILGHLHHQEIDMYCPDYKIGIEVNGCYWHSSNKKEALFHQRKYEECAKVGVRLITIWEDQIRRTPEIVESVILSKFGIYKERIGARKCTIRTISGTLCNQFLDKNHIQGATRASVHYGLFYKEELIGVMCFGKTNALSGSGKEEAWDLRRFCTKVHTQVIGAAQRMLQHFIRDYNPKKIVSWSSCDISDGDVYKKLGFERDPNITSAYWYIHKTKWIRYHRSSFQLRALKRMGLYDGRTEAEIMKDQPYFKIYDCGHIKWTMDIPKEEG